MLDDLRVYWRYARGLREFLRQPLTLADAGEGLAQQLARREQNFLELLKRGVFAKPDSPYLPLFRHAEIEFEDARRLVRDAGLRSALSTLYDAGIRVSLEEAKGRQPIIRGGAEIAVTERSFDNPTLARDLALHSSGSRSAGRRTVWDFDAIAYDAARFAPYAAALGLTERPLAVWLPPPPAFSGYYAVLVHAKNGLSTMKWFSPTERGLSLRAPRAALQQALMLAATRMWGPAAVPIPEPTPFEQAGTVARWLAEQVRLGRPAAIRISPSSAVRVCAAANAEGLDISGTLFQTAGETLTPAKAKAISSAGARCVSRYMMIELGMVGSPCLDAAVPDDVHVMTDGVEVVQRTRTVDSSMIEIGALSFTSLLPTAPKLLINVDSGDYGVLEDRPCSCYLGQSGYTLHLHSIGSYEKLTSEGVTFLGSELVAIAEQVLPRRFGGSPADYQFIDRRSAEPPKISLLVHPSVGQLDHGALVHAVLQTLGRTEPGRMMAQLWRSGSTLDVVRTAPMSTAAGKTLPLHVIS